MNQDLSKFKKEIRNAIADYISSEGCGCCRNNDAHEIAERKIAKLLNVPQYKDKSGHNFSKFKTGK